jgi:uncharacterized protein (TIGR02186 family)
MKYALFLLLMMCALILPGSLQAKPLVADLSQYRIEIDSSFNGTRLLLFGARNETGDIVVVVRGPEKRFTVRRKERVAGIWMNHRERRFDNVPTYYVLASSKPLSQMHPTEIFKSLRIGAKEAVMENGVGDPVFAAALLERAQVSQLYSLESQKVSFMGESLFKLVIPFPDNIPGGNYSADVYLFNDGQLTGMQSIPLHVEKTGFDAWVYDVAQNHSVLYGMTAILIAVSIGWGASSLMRRV